MNRVWQAETYNWWRLPLKSLGMLGITVSAAVIGILLPAVAGLAEQWLTTHLSSCVGVFGICLCAARAEVREQGARQAV